MIIKLQNSHHCMWDFSLKTGQNHRTAYNKVMDREHWLHRCVLSLPCSGLPVAEHLSHPERMIESVMQRKIGSTWFTLWSRIIFFHLWWKHPTAGTVKYGFSTDKNMALNDLRRVKRTENHTDNSISLICCSFMQE